MLNKSNNIMNDSLKCFHCKATNDNNVSDRSSIPLLLSLPLSLRLFLVLYSHLYSGTDLYGL